jgi:hypothetical protein
MGRKPEIPLNCLREFSKAKHLAFSDRELRYLKLLSGRPAWRLRNLGDMEKLRTKGFWISSHIVHVETYCQKIPGSKLPEVGNCIQTCHHNSPIEYGQFKNKTPSFY